MKRFSLVRSLNFWSLLLSPALGVQAQTAAPTPPAMTAPYAAGGIFTDKGELGLESVRNEAIAQSSATPRYKSNGEETRFYEGYFKATSNNTKLALLSDDGTSVWIDDELILERANQDQGFNPSLANTFALLSKTFVAGRIYHIQLQYTNTIHTGDADVDGLTLWAYDGGGEFVAPPTATPCTMTLTADNPTWRSAQLSWSRCSDSDFRSYKLYRSTQAGFTPGDDTFISRGEAESAVGTLRYENTGLQPATTYHYILRTAHGGTTTDASATVTTTEQDVPAVTFEGLARSCAGGVSVDGVHDFSITGTARREDGSLATNTEFKLSFENNRGHDYRGDDPSIQPDNWTLDQIKKAKFVTLNANGDPILHNDLIVTTNAQGQFGVRVLSSDIISSDIQINVRWENLQRQMRDAGTKNCNFVPALNHRGFGTEDEPDTDSGWKFDYSLLFEGRGDVSPAKFWVKSQKNPDLDIDTQYFEDDGETVRVTTDRNNWLAVGNHNLLVRIDELVLQDGTQVDPERFSDYLTLLTGERGIPTQQVKAQSSSEGANQVWLRSGERIRECQMVGLIAYELTQHME